MVEIDGIDFEDCPKISMDRRYRWHIYLLSKQGDDTKLKIDSEEVYHYNSPHITEASVVIYDSSTDQISRTSVYRDSNGTYIKKRGRRYRLDKFV